MLPNFYHCHPIDDYGTMIRSNETIEGKGDVVLSCQFIVSLQIEGRTLKRTVTGTQKHVKFHLRGHKTTPKEHVNQAYLILVRFAVNVLVKQISASTSLCFAYNAVSLRLCLI